MFNIDLNGLISTIATAIAAIVGGFLFSRLLTLSSEKSGFVRRIKELEADLLFRNKQSEDISDWLLWEDAKVFIRENGKEIIFNDAIVEEIINPQVSPYRSADEYRPFVQKLVEVKTDFFKFAEQLLHDEEYPEDFDDFYKIIKPAYLDRRYYYETIFNLFDNDTSRSFSTMNNSIKNITNGKEYRAKRLERDRLDGEIQNIEYQIDIQKKSLATYGKPDGLWLGLLVIVYACIVGVIWPVTLLPYPQGVYNDMLTKWVLLGWFFSTLLAIFAYLAWSTYRLTRK
ncbi:hypothetical protein SAMN04487969_1424 [Paenibacillus algorifonticola]|uniref:Uncharacterized protein n=1 Tax=Paenibacillus algorifonticola TaxID=684063 RepID=A0A1I2ITE1_9BACL|nr:hypothetical protein [Paenibacillus algorifonticola]SFF45692.1 hypothetical protein SAMN04487969_1424 [Paenibacillus algorifonticola]